MLDLQCLVCGKQCNTYSGLKHHLRDIHNIGISEYRKEYGIVRIAHNRKYKELNIKVPCHICDKDFFISTKQYNHRIKNGKIRFACSKDCINKLKSITIKEIRGTLESKSKTSNQMIKRWKDPEWRKYFSKQIKLKGQKWHTYRLSKTLKTCLSGKQTKPELIVESFIKNNNLPYKYVGSGEYSVGPLFPDFISNDGKTAICVDGCYWHGCQECFPGSTGKGISFKLREKTYLDNGVKLIVIWEHELKSDKWQNNLA